MIPLIDSAMTTKERLVKKLNNYFNWNIPLDIKVVSHQRRNRDCGAYSWYFIPPIDSASWGQLGSSLSMTELLKHDEFELYRMADFMYDITPKDN